MAMAVKLAGEIGKQYDSAFRTLREIVRAYPEAGWRKPHGDDYLVPCRIAYHLALCIEYEILSGFRDQGRNFHPPFGEWLETKAGALPGKGDFMVYLDGVLARAETEVGGLSDGGLDLPSEPEQAWAGACRMSLHLYMLRELSAHCGELNAMLVQDGAEDVIWQI